MRMKGEIERDILALDFDHTIILRPGILLGDRDKGINHKGFGNGTAMCIGGWLYRSRVQRLVGYPVYGDEVGKVGVHLALRENAKKVQIVESKEILDISDALKK